jgi:hypothetical protein
VIGGSKFPGVGKKDSDDFTRLKASRDQATRQAFDRFAVLGISEPTAAGSIDKRGFLGKATTGIKDDIVEKSVRGVREKSCAQHRGPL